MAKGWSEMRLRLADYVIQVRSPLLTPEQQGRLALAWPAIWTANDACAESWRKALGYTADEWGGVYDVWADVLGGRGPAWCLPFMQEEKERQAAWSEQQSAKGRASATRRNSGQPQSTAVNHAVGVGVGVGDAVETEEPTPLSVVDSGTNHSARSGPKAGKVLSPRDAEWAESFELFWAEYPRRQKRPDAEKAWMACPLREQEGFNQVMNGLYRWQKSIQWTKGAGQFVPNAGPWLRAAQYDDEIPEADNAL